MCRIAGRRVDGHRPMAPRKRPPAAHRARFGSVGDDDDEEVRGTEAGYDQTDDA